MTISLGAILRERQGEVFVLNVAHRYSLTHLIKKNTNWIGISMGAFDPPTDTRLALHIFVVRKKAIIMIFRMACLKMNTEVSPNKPFKYVRKLTGGSKAVPLNSALGNQKGKV